MSDLHSIAYRGTTSPFGGGGGWDLRAVNAAGSDVSYIDSENTPPFSYIDSDVSSGYLQDALFNFNSKRRRLLLFGDDDGGDQSKDLETFWSCLDDDGNINLDFYENYDSISGDGISKSGSRMSTEMVKRKPEEEEEAVSAFAAHGGDSSFISSRKSSDKPTPPAFSDGGRQRKKAMTKLVYPFAVVKPGGTEGDVTLKDINERILMPPTRPVKHPVGDFACRPLVSSDGPGLSGKAVVALTRIHTRGRGSITIIRTRG